MNVFKRLLRRDRYEIAHLPNAFEVSKPSVARDSIKLFESALVTKRKKGDHLGEADALVGLGNCHLVLGDAHRALFLYEQAQAIYHEFGDAQRQSGILNSIMQACIVLGYSDRATELMNEKMRTLGLPGLNDPSDSNFS